MTVTDTQSAEARPRALVVDDNDDLRELYAFMLADEDYGVATARSGAEALAEAAAVKFDLVLSDIGLPKMSGYELVAELRRLPGYRETIIVAVTGFKVFDDRARSLAAGFNDHFVKPFNMETLIKRAERLRRRR